MKIKKSKTIQNDTKKLFRKLGACSHTYFHLLNREFGHVKRIEERAADPLAGGIYQQGYQCGMLWGSSLAVGAESFRRNPDKDKATSVTIKATQSLMRSFEERTTTADCEEITNCDFTSKASMAKYFFSGKFLSCFTLAEEWTPEAIEAAEEGLSQENEFLPNECLSCASEVARKMGASDEEAMMVAGFAGGLGLSGNACGALSASIWMKNLERCKENEKTSYKDPNSEATLETFYKETDYEMRCDKIIGKSFESLDDHTAYIKNGGCEKLINTLSKIQ